MIRQSNLPRSGLQCKCRDCRFLTRAWKIWQTPSNLRLKPQEQPSQLILAPSDKEYEEADLDHPLRSFPVAGFKVNIVNICFYNFVDHSVTSFCSASLGCSGSSSGTAASRITRGCPPLSASTWTSTRGQGAHRWIQGHDILVHWNGSQHLSICVLTCVAHV